MEEKGGREGRMKGGRGRDREKGDKRVVKRIRLKMEEQQSDEKSEKEGKLNHTHTHRSRCLVGPQMLRKLFWTKRTDLRKLRQWQRRNEIIARQISGESAMRPRVLLSLGAVGSGVLAVFLLLCPRHGV